MYLKKYIYALIAFSLSCTQVWGQSNSMTNDENVVAQMNYCINSLTNIVHNKSMSVLEHESDQLINNLTMQQIIGLPEIRDFRIDLMDAVSKFEITEEERNLMRRIQSIKRDNMKWAAISNALSPTMLLTGNGGFGPQLAFQSLLSAARSVVEYKTMQGEQNIEELQAMWELRKEDMQTINELRKSAQGIVFDLYNKYHLNESDRLTEATANIFNDYITIADASRRLRLLQDNYEVYKQIPEYYYHLGMAYLDKGDYSNAKMQFSIYLQMYKRTPILRYDERSGCIALAMLTYDKTLSAGEKEELVSVAIKNLPSNSAAVLQCAMVYIYELREAEKGFQLIRAGIDDPQASDRDVLFMAAANLLPYAKSFPPVYRAILETFKNTTSVSFDSFLTYLIYSQSNPWEQINRNLDFIDCYKRTWYTFWIGKKFNDDFHLLLSNKTLFSSNDVYMYLEEHDNKEVIIHQLKATDCNSITEEEINDIDCFKANKNLKFLYVESLSDGTYKLKANLDLAKIKDESWPRQSEFTLTESDIDDIIDFCEDHALPESGTELSFSTISEMNKEFSKSSEDLTVEFYGDTLKYKVHHSDLQKGYYLRLVFANNLQVVYKYDDDLNTFTPYMIYDAKRYSFANSNAKNEYLYIEKADKKPEDINDDPSWWSKIWSSISSWFSSNDDAKKEDDIIKDKNVDNNSGGETSWWESTWSYIKNIF